MGSNQPHVVGFCGSLRKGSFNRSLLLHAAAQLPGNYRFTLADISGLPLYNEDLERDLPQSVRDLAELAKSADAFLISTPEYNFSVPGVLKNALDWLSRKNVDTPLALKPVAVMGATQGMFGTAQAQVHLRELLYALNMSLVRRPLVLVGQVQEKINSDGQVTDEMTKQFIEQLIGNLVKEIEQNK
ncbi:NADPH-dependent FMN reductase [Brevibacillus massiliensis]|jgi:chromate reductase|uniref:NADPH-dependent FMN reductase n=1 Tax=Brevibacillus massiliensis TaxID=1118054 RepID=UPI0002E202BF|nr:NAD(P)H-dependent oxidoreductase [Brevibacillus massiliensis]